MDVVLDGAVEIGFADTDGQNRYVTASPVLFGDEFHLFEHTVAYNLPQGSRTLVDREADGIPNGPDRLYRLGRMQVPDDDYTVPFGKAAVIREGDDITLVAHPLKDGSKGASLFYVILPDGKRLYHDIARPKGES